MSLEIREESFDRLEEYARIPAAFEVDRVPEPIAMVVSVAMDWAGSRGCRRLRIETQDINVAAVRFHECRGCVPGAVNPRAYPEFPDETRLLWYRELV